MPSFLRDSSIVNQLVVIQLAFVLLVFTTLTVFVNHEVNRGFMETVEHSVIEHAEQLSQNIDFYNTTLQQQTNRIADVFVHMFPGEISNSSGEDVSVGSYQVSLLMNAGKVITNNFDKPDKFTEMTGGTATVFMRVGDDFLRVSTSLRKTDGSRAFGTMLGKSHPGYNKLINGEEYKGPAYLFGRHYMTKYIPFKNNAGEVAGILYVGFDYTASLAELKKSISKLSIGETGFAFIVDLKEGKTQGNLVLHPSGEGKRISAVLDNGNKILNTIMTSPEGVLHIPAVTTTGEIKNKLLAFSHAKQWNWGVVVGSYEEEFTRAADQLNLKMILLSIVSAFIITGLLFITLRIKLKPIETICGYMQSIGDGDLTTRINTDMGSSEASKNEIHQLSRSAKATVGGLRSVIKQLNNTMSTISTHLQTVSGGIDLLHSDLNRQQQETEMVASAISEMTSASEEVANSAASAAEQTQLASSEANNGDVLVQKVVNSIQSISSEVGELTNMIEQVEQNSNSIGTVMDVIQNIAEQTNLLALNAAIEAARAGEAGRGFSVVADEVRNLAQQTAKSTTEIREMIERLQGNTRTAVQRMGMSNEKVKGSVEMTSQAREALIAITTSVSNISDASVQIASAAEEQTSVSEDVSRNIENISTIAIETSNSSQKMAKAVSALDNAGTELQRVIGLFRT